MRLIPGINEAKGEIIEGENLEIMKTLADTGFRGKFNMIYFDGPFNSGLLFSLHNSKYGFEYIDPWAQFHAIHNYVQPSRYLEHYRKRIELARELLREDGIFVLQTNQLFGHHIKALLDDVFGRGNMLPEVIWKHSAAPWNVMPGYPVGYQHETIYFYSKSAEFSVRQELPSLLPSVWDDITGYAYSDEEETHYPSQKPEKLIERILDITSREGDLVGDFYCGSGTFPFVAEKMKRQWISCDHSLNAIQLTCDRLAKLGRPIQVHHTQDEFQPSYLNGNEYTKPVPNTFSGLELESLLQERKGQYIEVNAYSYSFDIDLIDGKQQVTFNLILPFVNQDGYSETETVKMPRPFPIVNSHGVRLIVPNPVEWVLYHLVMVQTNALNQINLGRHDQGYRHIVQWEEALKKAEEIVSAIDDDWVASIEEKDGIAVITDIFGYHYKIKRNKS